jgi:hypothetical protein
MLFKAESKNIFTDIKNKNLHHIIVNQYIFGSA